MAGNPSLADHQTKFRFVDGIYSMNLTFGWPVD